MSFSNQLKNLIPPKMRAQLRDILGISRLDNRIDRLEARLVENKSNPGNPPPAILGGLPVVQQISLDYPVHSVPRYGSGKPPHPMLLEILERNKDRYRTTLQNALQLKEYFTHISVTDPGNPEEPYWYNGWLPALDGIAIYYYLYQNKPVHYFEVGSGNSTKYARKSIRDHHLPTRIISVDPQPRAEIDQICDRIIRQPLEEVDLSIFDELEKGDILFIDGSHRCFMNSDATVAFIDLLPRLKPGILVEFHDIFLPYDYPASWSELYYTEQYLLAAYLLAETKKFDVALPLVYISNDAELSHIFDPLWDDPRMVGSERHGVSFWIETR